MSWNFGLVAEKLAKEMTRRIGLRWGKDFPFHYVCAYPKSGGTWLAEMVSDYLGLPFPRYVRLPVAFACVLQSQWTYDPRLARVFYLYRDGRDVVTSLYYDRLRIARHSDRPGRARISRTYERLLGKGYDPADIERHLPRFIDFEFRTPGRGSPVNWRDHVEGWLQAEGRDGVAVTSYEALRRDCEGTLATLLERVTGEAIDAWRLSTTVEKLSMRRRTGRSPGEGDQTQHIRKGIVGDWRRVFTREAAEVFDHHAGGLLVRLGYEKDRAWVTSC